MYPVLVSYSFKYAMLILLTAFVKLIMAMVYIIKSRKAPSPVYKALILDSLLDFGLTITAILGFYLVEKLNYAIDGVFGIIIGIIILAAAAKSVWQQAKILVND